MTFKTLLRLTSPPLPRLLILAGLLCLSSLAVLAQPWLAGRLTETILTQPMDWIGRTQVLLWIWLGLVVIRSSLQAASAYAMGATGEQVSARLRMQAYDHAQRLPLAWQHERRQGDVIALLSQDTMAISRFVTQTLVSLLPALLTFAGALVMMTLISPAIALVAVLLLPLYFVAMRLVARRLRPLARRFLALRSEQVALVQENLSVISALKAFRREKLESTRFEKVNEALRNTAARQAGIQSVLRPVTTVLASAGLLLLVWLGVQGIQNGELQPSALVSVLLYAMLLTQPLATLAGVYGQVQQALGAAERIELFFDARPEQPVAGKPRDVPVRGLVEYVDVTFRYPGREPVLERFNLRIEPGETVALTGPNGAGKTTLAKLLLRFMEPESGEIRIDGVDIRNWDLDALRATVAWVPQHAALINATIRENLLFARPDAGSADIEHYARLSGADEFIQRLPEGYETVIGDRGVKLSGGQKQRLSLARGLLTEAPVLILDEATSMLSPEAHDAIIERCADYLADRTVLFITHQSRNLETADRRFEMTVNAAAGEPVD